MTPKDDPFTSQHSEDDDSWQCRIRHNPVDEKQAFALTLQNLGLLHRASSSNSQTRYNHNNNNDSSDRHNPIWDDDSSSCSSSSSDNNDDCSCESGDDESDVGPVDGEQEALILEFEQTYIGFGNSSSGSSSTAGLYGLSCRSYCGLQYGMAFCPQREAEEERNAAKLEQEKLDQKHKEDEQVFRSNLRRRSIKFVEHPQVKEYEPAPLDTHQDLYYSCHQLQKFVDEANAEKEIVAVVISADV